MTGDEIQEAFQSAAATNTGPDGQPATILNVYLRYVREVRSSQPKDSCTKDAAVMNTTHACVTFDTSPSADACAFQETASQLP